MNDNLPKQILKELTEIKNRYKIPKEENWFLSFSEEMPCDIFSKEVLTKLHKVDLIHVNYTGEYIHFKTKLFKLTEKQLEEEVNEDNQCIIAF